ncbi:MAG TPA: carboxypeptidase-like regulatory domain-containing protein, partial [Polyangia bacterium]|nr:carboxypeptidase-like regulatory domain-containing protein [Polyangia bacterium]
MEIASARRAWWAVALAVFLAGAGVGCHRRPPEASQSKAGSSAIATAARLTGRVVDAAGRPVPDAVVLAFPLVDAHADAVLASQARVRAVADVDGRFTLSAPPGAYRLLVEAAGFPLAARAPVEVPSADLTLAVEGQGRTITGMVLRDGAPADGATVRLAAE